LILLLKTSYCNGKFSNTIALFDRNNMSNAVLLTQGIIE
jgi:hypothetical protein